MAGEAELEAALAGEGIDIVVLEALPLSEQMRVMSGCTEVVSGHGAGLVGIAVMRPEASVVEFTSGEVFEECYRRMAALRGIDYTCVTIDGDEAAPQGSAAAIPQILEALRDRARPAADADPRH